MKTLAIMLLAVPGIALAAPAPAPASAPVQLTSSIMAEKTETVDGRERVVLRAPERVVPGDRLIFQTSYRNSGRTAATNVVVVNPVPSAVVYAGVGTAGAVVSVDGGRTFGPLATLKVKGANGQPRAAQASDVTTLRWTLASVAPGASGVLNFRAVVR